MTAPPQRILIVESRYYPSISDPLLDGALTAAAAAEVECDIITLSTIVEIPPAIALAERAAREADGVVYDGFVALACVLDDDVLENSHLVAAVTRSLIDLSVARSAVIGQGLMQVPTEADGVRWAREVDGGGIAVRSCLEMAALKQRLAGA